MRARWLVPVLLSACSFSDGARPDSGSGSADAPSTTDAGNAAFGWSTPVELAELTDTQGVDDPSLTNDLLEIYFGSRRPGSMSSAEDIWMAKRNTTSEPFGTPNNVSALNSTGSETTAKITGDGTAIFFASNRGGNGHDIYVSTRADRDSSWGIPVRVAELSTSNGDWSPYSRSDLLRLVLCSGADIPSEALYTSQRSTTSASWSTPSRIDELDEPGKSECDPDMPTDRALYYSSDYLAPDFTTDIYRASRVTTADPWGNRTSISINMPAVDDRDPWVSPDERTLAFASDRNGVNYALYISTRQ
jgi:Tol biopolymer transport system component